MTWKLRWPVGIVAIAASAVVFLVPFAFILLTASKTGPDASDLSFSLPKQWVLIENIKEVLHTQDYVVLRAFINSITLTVGSVTVMVVLAAMVGYVLQRRRSRINTVVHFLVLAGLIVPPAVVPTIWVLQGLGIFKTMIGMILIEVTFGLSFCVLLFRAFVGTIPRELDEAAIVDGAGPLRLFFSVIVPLLRPVMITVIVVQAVAVFNDFTGPLYFLPGDAGVTVQLTLYNFQSQTLNQWNLLFADILLITIPPLVMYIFFNRQIVAGMTSGAVKG
ncbi:raffinose/stachyose/melibiose transport system permease protein [Friedmanniella endophytica]|uniref:Raffinose/stachyose/melibiose transport system permease protein n=1 Tax=Microlunatus kandeliicorticis TaxID=1759536 RepID=A0A7W3IP00_9ACTN|nr:carbohydrate ABC transporter permease [Microlunatus kandeliicorticis]MBA8792595.1 raffinose/stachyose/melibiose transport system permease protein [Microlunatus kandeliicorticis]